jgi:hypothetical protein
VEVPADRFAREILAFLEARGGALAAAELHRWAAFLTPSPLLELHLDQDIPAFIEIVTTMLDIEPYPRREK